MPFTIYSMLDFKKWLEIELPKTVVRSHDIEEESPTTGIASNIKQIMDQIDVSRPSRMRPEAAISGSPHYMSPEQATGEVDLLPDRVESFLRTIELLLPIAKNQLKPLLEKWRNFRGSLYQQLGEARFPSQIDRPHKVNVGLAIMSLKELNQLLPKLYEPLQQYNPSLFNKFRAFYDDFEQSQEMFQQAINLQKRSTGYADPGPLRFPQAG